MNIHGYSALFFEESKENSSASEESMKTYYVYSVSIMIFHIKPRNLSNPYERDYIYIYIPLI